MKKIIAIILVLAFAFALVGCNNSDKIEVATNTEHVENSIIKAPRFSYEEEKETYSKEKDGVKLDGFKNTEKTKIKTIKEAAELALKERTIDSDSTNVYYDAKTKVCKVVFSTEGEEGYTQSVYMDKEGKTVMMVYVK